MIPKYIQTFPATSLFLTVGEEADSFMEKVALQWNLKEV